MNSVHAIVGKLRNARFQPPGGKPLEKLAWINGVEADLLRKIGGSGRKAKFGLPSFSWRDDTDSSETRGGTQDGNGGSQSAGGGDRGGGDGNYTFRGVPGTRNVGNWNTGGAAVATGSFERGLTPMRAARPMAPQVNPLGGVPSQVPPVTPPVALPPAYPPLYGAPPTRVDLNPATLAPWTGVGMYPSTFPARPGVSPRIGNRNKDQSRLPGMDSAGRVGGGRGGGGGGGW